MKTPATPLGACGRRLILKRGNTSTTRLASSAYRSCPRWKIKNSMNEGQGSNEQIRGSSYSCLIVGEQAGCVVGIPQLELRNAGLQSVSSAVELLDGESGGFQ